MNNEINNVVYIDPVITATVVGGIWSGILGKELLATIPGSLIGSSTIIIGDYLQTHPSKTLDLNYVKTGVIAATIGGLWAGVPGALIGESTAMIGAYLHNQDSSKHYVETGLAAVTIGMSCMGLPGAIIGEASFVMYGCVKEFIYDEI